MRMGYQPQTLDGMRLSTLIHMAEAYAEANNPTKIDSRPREGTQSDIAAIFG